MQCNMYVADLHVHKQMTSKEFSNYKPMKSSETNNKRQDYSRRTIVDY